MTRKKSLLQAEIKQTRPFPSAAAEASVALLKTADVIRRALARVIEKEEVTVQQYNVLRILRGAGEGGIPTLEIVERLIEETPGITRLLDRLEVKGLVRRERCLRDRRQVLCWITPAGLALLSRLDKPVDDADAHVLAALNAKEIRALIDILEKIRAGHAG